MTVVREEECGGVKEKEGVEVCKVECIYEADTKESTLNLPMFIHVDECIDCFACLDVCPVAAIVEEVDAEEKWLKVNTVLSEEHDGV